MYSINKLLVCLKISEDSINKVRIAKFHNFNELILISHDAADEIEFNQASKNRLTNKLKIIGKHFLRKLAL